MSNTIKQVAQKIKEADAILIGASNGLSITEGLHLFASNEAFYDVLGDYAKKYGIRNILEGFFYPWPTLEEKWAFLARLINHYSGDYTGSQVMTDLRDIVGDKPYFVVTSNAEGHFELSGFEPEQVYVVEVSWLSLRCSAKCHHDLYPSMDAIKELAANQKDFKVPTELIPRCPKCGAPMELYNADPVDETIINNWSKFLTDFHGKKLVVLELGIGWRNQLIKAPFMRLVGREPNATYVTINKGEIYITDDIKEKSFGLDGYLSDILADIKQNL